MTNPVETYLKELYATRSTGAAVKEQSYYPALSELLNAVGKSLKPKVRCVMNLQNQGAGLPDGGFFTATQLQRSPVEPMEGQIPERGCIEAKGTGEEVEAVAASEQVERYLRRYGQVLVTNYRDFVLVGFDAEGKPAQLERYRLAGSEAEFWTAVARPQATAAAHAERFIEYLKRVMQTQAALVSPEDVAWFLASYARDARARIEGVELPALSNVRAALEEALGLRFEGEEGEHFFRSTLVQTLFYGVFSAWVLWSRQHAGATRSERFDWRTAIWLLRVPMIKTLFHQVASPDTVRRANLEEVLNWTASVLNRIDREAFFARFEEGHAVQYFYEPFLQAFDPELRKQLGVWYTPTEIVRYMVARVDAALREELGIADGLADPRIYVLDPCCGTGAYLVEVLRRIGETLAERGEDALAANDLKRAALERVYGFEILPAPFVVAHLQLGLLLQHLGAPLAEHTEERVGVYLTNALTGWEPPKEPKTRLLFPELEQERDAAERVKRDAPILVILGNPPYNAFAGTSPEEEQGLVEPYKAGLISEWGIKKFNLDDLYVRFFRLAERRIAEKTREGVVCFISNFSYLSDPSFVVMRKRFLQEFDALWFDSLNGDSRETGKLTPEGKPDPSIFSTQYNREGIRVGTAIGLMVRKQRRDEQPTVRFRQFWGITKRPDLLASLDADNHNAPQYEIAAPDKSNRFSFRISSVSAQYKEWPKLVELCGQEPISGLQEMRKGALMSIKKEDIERRMRLYYDFNTDWDTLKALNSGLTENGGGFDAKAARPKIQTAEGFNAERIVRYSLYPFDNRWCYYSAVPTLWNRPRPQLASQCWQGNSFIITRMMAERPHEQIVITTTSALPDYHLLRPNAVAIPLRLRAAPAKKNVTTQNHFFPAEAVENATIANLSSSARAYLAALGIENPDADEETAGLVWMHALAVGYAPAYLSENADGIRGDWPRVPLPGSKELLLESAALGRRVAALLDTEQAVKGVTTGAVEAVFRSVASISRAGGGALLPEAGDLEVRAGWGHAGKGGVTMPGKGRWTERACTAEELAAIDESAARLWLTTAEARARLGETTLDVFLNDVAYWRNVPVRVWDYTIGGYQVLKKWLSYRERELLGRALTPDEAREATNIARRIAALLLLEPALDASYHAVRQATYKWPGASV
ncbi:MAG TPA: type ISP restriction/modification enzyme [Pyrinomonadaceae bacterium]|jgi:hypothetical protein